MIVQLNCSISWSKSNLRHILSSTGGLEQTASILINDTSIFVDIETIRLANAKMIELKHEKEKNNQLLEIINNDSIIIDAQNKKINNLEILIEEIQEDITKTESEYKEKLKKVKREKGYAIGSGLGLFGIIVLLLL